MTARDVVNQCYQQCHNISDTIKILNMKNHFFLVFCLISGFAFGQRTVSKRHIDMIHFLVAHKQFVTLDTADFTKLDGYMFDRIVIEMKHLTGPSRVHIFGSTSPHGKFYIALEDSKGMQFIEANEMVTDIPAITDFFKKNKGTGPEINKTLSEIAHAYLQNSISYKEKIED